MPVLPYKHPERVKTIGDAVFAALTYHLNARAIDAALTEADRLNVAALWADDEKVVKALLAPVPPEIGIGSEYSHEQYLKYLVRQSAGVVGEPEPEPGEPAPSATASDREAQLINQLNDARDERDKLKADLEIAEAYIGRLTVALRATGADVPAREEKPFDPGMLPGGAQG